MKGGNESLTYYGPRDLTNLVSFVNDATEFFGMPSSPKVGGLLENLQYSIFGSLNDL